MINAKFKIVSLIIFMIFILETIVWIFLLTIVAKKISSCRGRVSNPVLIWITCSLSALATELTAALAIATALATELTMLR